MTATSNGHAMLLEFNISVVNINFFIIKCEPSFDGLFCVLLQSITTVKSLKLTFKIPGSTSVMVQVTSSSPKVLDLPHYASAFQSFLLSSQFEIPPKKEEWARFEPRLPWRRAHVLPPDHGPHGPLQLQKLFKFRNQDHIRKK